MLFGLIAGGELRVSESQLQVLDPDLPWLPRVEKLKDVEQLALRDFASQFEDVIEV